MSALIDTHAHFDDLHAEGAVATALSAAREAGVEHMLAIGGGPQSNRLAVDLAHEHSCLSASCGFDRDLAASDPDFGELRSLLAESAVVAVGECGLDYHYEPDTAAAQKRLFESNLELALDHELPVVVHSRDADEDTLALLREYARVCDPSRAAIGVLHCYTRGKGMARQLLDMGFHISLSGIATFRNAATLREVAAYLPSDRIVIETDSPYLAPEPVRGRANRPEYLPHVARLVAEVRATSFDDFAAASTLNAKTLFGLYEDV